MRLDGDPRVGKVVGIKVGSICVESDNGAVGGCEVPYVKDGLHISVGDTVQVTPVRIDGSDLGGYYVVLCGTGSGC